MTKCIFTTRLKECCKEKGYTQDALAKELNISVNGLKRYFRTKNDRLPPLDLLEHMAELLNVDIDYLLGKIDRKKHSQQTIESITGFYGDIVPLITRGSATCPKICGVISLLAKSNDFEQLCLLIEELFEMGLFGSETIVTINTNKRDNFNYAYSEKKALKARIIDIFDNILEEIFHGEGYGSDEKTGCEMCCRLLEMITLETNKKAWDRNSLYTKIQKELENISHISRDEFILIYTPRQIVHDKFFNLKQYYKEKSKEYFLDVPTNF